MKKLSILTIIIFVILSLSVHCKQAGAYLNMGSSARALGMGNAFSALSDDASASYYNPAGLAQLKERQMSTMHAVLDNDRRYNFINYVSPLKKKAWYGVSWTRFGIDKIEERDALGTLTGYMDDSENCFSGTYAFDISGQFSAGFSLKYIRQVIQSFQADAFGMDAGFLYRPEDYVSFSLVFRDIATDLKWNTDSGRTDSIPMKITSGMVFKPKEYLNIAVDAIKEHKEDLSFHFGMEGWFENKLGLRFGVNDGNLTVGAGFRQNDWMIDYGFEDDPEGDVHRISGTLRFDL